MSTKHIGIGFVAAALVTLLTGCAHQLAVLNLVDYQVPGVVELSKATTIGLMAADSDDITTVLVNGIAAGLQRSGAQVVNPYRPALDQRADLIAKIAIKSEFEGSGANFWINFPGFLVWAPAWHGYVYKANFDIHVELVKGSDHNTVVSAIDLPIRLDLRHAEMDRTWTEVSWLEVGAIALGGGLVFMKYDTDVTPLLMKEIERPIGEYVAKKILLQLPNR